MPHPTPLHEYERAILCVCLNDSHAIIPIMEVLDDPDFMSLPLYRQAYDAILVLAHAGTLPNIYTVADKSGIPVADLQVLAAGFNTKLSKEIIYTADLVRKDGLNRRVRDAAAQAVELASTNTDDPQGLAVVCAEMIMNSAEAKSENDPTIAEVGKRFDAEVAGLASGIGGISIKNKLDWLQEKTAGLRPGKVWVIAAPYKCRKCVTGDTMIFTRSGWQRIDAACGDVPFGFTEQRRELLTRAGWQSISHVFRAPAGPTIKIRTAKGYALEGTPDHPILISGDGGLIWRKLSDLQVGDHAAIVRHVAGVVNPILPPPPSNLYSYRNIHNGLSLTFPKQMTPELARFLGYIVAEGTVSQRNKISFTNETPEMVTDFLGLCNELFNIEAKQYGIDCHVNSKWLREWLAECGIDYVVAAGKTVPWVVLQADLPCQAAFLNALYSGDGWVSGNGTSTRRVNIMLASQTLIAQIQTMLLAFGIISSQNVKHDKAYDRNFYGLGISGDNAVVFAEVIGFVSKAKAAKLALRVNADMALQRRHSSDPIPGMRKVLQRIWDAVPGERRPGLNHLFDGRREGNARNVEITHRRATRIMAEVRGLVADDVTQPLAEAVTAGFYYDPIIGIETGWAETWDVTVPEDHSFVSNGFISHNTTLMRNMVIAACRAGASLDIFALEGTESDTYASLTAMLATEKLLAWGFKPMAQLSETFMLRGIRTPEQQRAITDGRAELDSWNLRIYDARKRIARPDRLIHFIKRDRVLHGLNVYVVDYLQLLGDGKLFDRMESSTHRLGNLTVEEGLTAILIAQQNEATIGQSADNYSPGVKGGGDAAAVADYLLTTKYNSAGTPDVLTVNLKLARHTRPGIQNYWINPDAGLLLGPYGKAEEA